MIAASKINLPIMPRAYFIKFYCHSAAVFSIHKMLSRNLLEANALGELVFLPSRGLPANHCRAMDELGIPQHFGRGAPLPPAEHTLRAHQRRDHHELRNLGAQRPIPLMTKVQFCHECFLDLSLGEPRLWGRCRSPSQRQLANMLAPIALTTDRSMHQW